MKPKLTIAQFIQPHALRGVIDKVEGGEIYGYVILVRHLLGYSCYLHSGFGYQLKTSSVRCIYTYKSAFQIHEIPDLRNWT